MDISVVLATYNEEKNLADCLESVKDLAKEIIVVDGSSSDKTVDVAKSFGARVKIVDNLPNFHINKQKAIDMATSEWILQLDADERVSPELANEIRKVIGHKPQATSHKSIQGFWIPRKNYFLGRFLRKGGQYPDYTLRLYHNGKGKLPQKDVHEQAVVEGKVAYLKNPLIHIADPNFSRYLKRYNRYTTLIAKELKEKEVRYNPLLFIKYVIVLPLWWFLLTYVRHKGFVDSWQGFVFSFFSALRFPVAYIKYLRE
ncbi:glycosyltransferase family 2 protein [Candidatus Parcubacteria bacterium]|nr:MAG: glycosyltransferase family 2 protein [Candidatus Parcubacteria bacterium]